jgi:hypothetical protein
MEFKELRPGEALPPPPAGEEKAFTLSGSCRLMVIRHQTQGYANPHYDVMAWGVNPNTLIAEWRPVVVFTYAPVVAYAFLRPDKILEGVRAKVEADRGTAGQPGAVADNEGLRPCPFCGETASTHMAGAWCNNDRCRMGWLATRTAWNTRPIEDKLREQIAKDHDQIRHLQQAEAEAMALVLAHEGRIEILGKELAGARSAARDWQKAADSWREAWGLADLSRQKLASLTTFISEAWGREGEKTLDTLRRVQEGREELGLFDRAELRARQEHETANRIADWLAAKPTVPGSVAMQLACMWAHDIRNMATGVATEVDLPTWAKEEDPGDWAWAKQMALALVRWSTNGLSAAENTKTPNVRRATSELLAMVELGLDEEENG